MFLKLLVILFFCQSRKHSDGCVGPSPLHRLSSAVLPTGLQANLETMGTLCLGSSTLHFGALDVPHEKLMLWAGAGIVDPGCGDQGTI